MKLHSATMELRAVKTICAGGKPSNRVLGLLNPDMLNSNAANTAYRRIIALTRKGGSLPSWDTLCNDPVISEQDRKTLQKFKKPAFKKGEVRSSIGLLKKFWIKRHLLMMADSIVQDLQKDSVDVDVLLKDVVNKTHIAQAGNKDAKVYTFGANSNVDKLLKSIIKGKGIDGVPSFYEAWDDVNKVIPRTAVFMLAGPTGGGKSQIALNMGMNQAEGGFTVCLGSFEMDAGENLIRMVARESEIPIHKVQQGSEGLTANEAKKAVKSYKAWEKRCDKSGGALHIVENENLPTVTEFLYSCKAYAPDIIIIDYLALLDGIDGDDDWRMLAEAVRQCKRFAKQNKIPVVILAQLDDDGKSLRYSKRMLDDCDIAWFWKAGEDEKETGIMPVEHKKARNVKPIKFDMFAEFEIARMRTATEKDRIKANKKRGEKLSKPDKDGKGKPKKSKKAVLRDLTSASLDDL